MAHFNIKKQVDGQFYFVFYATGNNEPMLKSEGYPQKTNCQNGIASAKINCQYDFRYDKKTTWNGSQYYFVLKGANGETLGTSEMYNTTYNRDNGIAILKSQMPSAEVRDLT